MQQELFNDVAVGDIVAASASLKDYLIARKEALLTEIREAAKLDDALTAKLKTATEEWKQSYVTAAK